MKRVLIRAPLVSQSGYGVHSRQIFRYCESQKDWNITTEILPWGITPWNVNREEDEGIYGRIMSASTNKSNAPYDISFQIQLPHEWDPSLAKYNVGVTAGVETTKCSDEWANFHRNKMDLLIVPSSFAKSTFDRGSSGHKNTPIVVLPEAYFGELTHGPNSDPLENISTQKNLLTVGTLTSDHPSLDRKNLLASISWFLRTFKTKDVGLIVKTSKGRDTSIDRELVRKMMKHVKKNILGDTQVKCKIYMLHGPMTRKEMRDLYKSPKLCGLISTTRGEGFGLPLLEAAVSGLPIVATDWSAHTEYLTGPSFLRAHYDLRLIPSERVDGKIFVEGAKWAEAREGNFCRKMKQIIEDPQKYKNASIPLSEKLKKTHSLNNLQQSFNKIITEYIK